MQLFLFALVSGRQLLVGAGIVPELLCGDNGAYVCGVDSEAKEWRKTKSRGTADWRDLFSNKQITDSPLNWFQYANVGAAVMRGVPAAEIDVNFKALCLECIYRSLRCPVVNAHNGLDRESCVMLRAMQLLLPGTMLRDRFSRAARITAAERWLGVIQDLDIVLKHSTAPDTATQRKFDWDRHIFFDPPTSRLDASTRFAGAIHIRALPPKLERDGSDIHQKHYIQFMGQLNSTHASFWVCAAKNALLADDQHRREQWPRSIFIATDSEGLCRMARNRLSLGLDDNDDPRAMFLRKGPVAHSDKATAAEQDIFRNPIACMDVSPTHLVKTERIHAQVKGGLDSHQLTILDWHFLARSRWLVSVTRIVNRCQRGAERDGTHNVGGPGRSFYGWALAASGLVHPPPNVHTKGCPCQLDGRTVSIWCANFQNFVCITHLMRA